MKVGNLGFDHFKITCIIGMNEKERLIPQDIFVDLSLEHDFSKCSKSEALEDTLCYVMLSNLCKELAVTKKYQLLETFACDIIDTLLLKHSIKWVYVKIKKPLAIRDADFAFVTLEGGQKS